MQATGRQDALADKTSSTCCTGFVQFIEGHYQRKLERELMTAEQQLELMRGMLNDLIIKVDQFVEAAKERDAAYERRDAEYHKLRQRLLRGALGLLGVDEHEGE